MKLLYLGDIMGEAGIQVVQDMLPKLIDAHEVDVVLAQSENVTNGKSMSVKDMKRLQLSGVDIFTGGNHSIERKDIMPLLKDDKQPVIAPANMVDNPGSGIYIHQHQKEQLIVVSLLGTVLPSNIQMENPFTYIDTLLKELPTLPSVIIVNMHAEYSSEKVLMGYQLDGKVSAVIGDHWHVPTADARILPGGTAHITDVGMCGALNGSLGAEATGLLNSIRHDTKLHPKIEMDGPRQLCGLLIETKPTGLANSVQQIILQTKA